MSTLWTGASPPDVMIERLLCQEYGCLPSQLDQEDAERMLDHLMIIGEEAKKRQAKVRKHGR